MSIAISTSACRARACRTWSTGMSGCNRGPPIASTSACHSVNSTVGLSSDLNCASKGCHVWCPARGHELSAAANAALHRPTWNLVDRPSPLARDEVLADHLRDVLVKCDGELVLLDAFDLAVAEHRMMHGVANREQW